MLTEILLRDTGYSGVKPRTGSLYRSDTASNQESEAVAYLAALWSVRAFTRKPYLIQRDRFLHDIEALDVMGLSSELIEEESRDVVVLALRERLAALHANPAPPSGPLFENIARLSKFLELSPVEMALLTFAVVLHGNEDFETTLDIVGDIDKRALLFELSNILRFSIGELRQAFSADSPLSYSGLLWLERRSHRKIGGKLQLLEGLVDDLSENNENLEQLFTRYFHTSPGSRLKRDDFHYLDMDWLNIEVILKDAFSHDRSGINILLHGPPGVGKTELARCMGSALNVDVFEIAFDKESMDSTRLRAFSLAQQVLKRRKPSLVVFDEIEDAFPQSRRSLLETGRESGRDKAWTNRLLETNPVPSIWLTNVADSIDEAFLRRFEYVAELPTPPNSVTMNMLKKSLEGITVDQSWLRQASAYSGLVPSEIHRLARVTRAATDHGVSPPEKVFDHAFQGMQRAMGHEWHPPRAANDTDEAPEFDYAMVNSDTDLAVVTAGLKDSRCGRIVLYGPPGTGKSLYARHLAEKLEQSLIRRKASDLMSMWFGGTEQNLAGMFRDAIEKEAILLLDEADSFLRHRSNADRRLEVTQVNELLTQMEEFEGVFVCATNMFENLDSAVLRRFDLKIRLGYLNVQKAWKLFMDLGASLNLPGIDQETEHELRRELSRLSNLTPGDFAVARRRHRVTKEIRGYRDLAEMLKAESKLKPGHIRIRPGFI